MHDSDRRDMKEAMVIQDSLRSLGGGEMVCITTCLALQGLGYHGKLVSDKFEADEIEAVFGMGEVIRKCEHIRIPRLGRKMARFSAVPGLLFAWWSERCFRSQSADVVFVTRDPRPPSVLPERPLFRFVYEVDQLRPFWTKYGGGLRVLYQALYERRASRATFLALSSRLVSELKANGHPNTELVYPSYGLGYSPRPKKDQIVYVTFLAPQKQVEDFNEIARSLPKYQFLLVGRDTPRVDRIYNGYASRILANKPRNVRYIETRIRQTPELLEESRIYLHTSKELGMPISVMEALSAGCVPVTPTEGGGAEVLEVARAGFRYERIEDAVSFIEAAMGDTARALRIKEAQGMSSEEIAAKGKIFSLDSFQDRISRIIDKSHRL